MISFSVLFLIVVILFVIYSVKLWNERPKGFPPGPPRLPIWGSYWFVLKENYFILHRALFSLSKKYKTDILGFYLGEYPSVAVFSNELCKEMLTRDEFIGRLDTHVSRSRGFGKLIGLFFADGLFWKEQRRFGLRHMRDYGFGRRSPYMEDNVERELKELIELMTSDPKPEDADVVKQKGRVYMPDIFFGTLINSILLPLTAKKFKPHELRGIARAAIRFMRKFDATGNALAMTPWLKYIAPDFFGDTCIKKENGYIADFLRIVVQDHKETFIPNQPRDLIDVYLEEMENLKGQDTSFSEEQLVYMVMDFMFPSPVGIGHTMQFLFVYMLNCPEVQEKIQKEIDSVVGRSRFPTLDDRKNMPYTEATVREVMRIDVIVPMGIPRRAVVDTTLGGYFIPKDTLLLPCLWSAHNDPKLFKEPEKFKPDRWLDENGQLLKKDITMPFGAGKRLCAGETFARNTIFLLLSGLVQNLTFKMPEGTPLPDPTNLTSGLTVTVPEFWIDVKWRE